MAEKELRLGYVRWRDGIDGKTYRCVKETNFSPEEQADAWEVYLG